jgi:quaternary ammonium compound-resistance protein SugE
MILPWIYLVLAAAAEALFGIGLYHSRGLTVFWPSVIAVLGGTATAILLGIAMKELPIGVSFVVWSGLAAIATAVYGIVALGESRDIARIGFMVLIIGGIAGLKFTSSH